MMIPGPLYYLAEATEAQEGDTLQMSGSEGHHAVDVRRLRSGESISLGDGRGRVCVCRVIAATHGELAAEVLQILEDSDTGSRVTLIQALAKGGRDELAIQAATEAGVWAVQPWQARRSVSRWEGRKVTRGLERWQSVVREAAKQSLRATIPEVLPLCTDPGGRDAVAAAEVQLVLDPTAPERLSRIQIPAGASVSIVVGPEGGIPQEDLAQLAASGVHRVRLGETVLRTSTAGVAALAILSAATGRW